jgi:hypothetical protein
MGTGLLGFHLCHMYWFPSLEHHKFVDLLELIAKKRKDKVDGPSNIKCDYLKVRT